MCSSCFNKSLAAEIKRIRKVKFFNNQTKSRWRGKAMYSQEFVALKLGYKKAQISRWETGERIISIYDLCRVLKFYNIDYQFFINKVVSNLDTKCDKQSLTD